MIASAQSHRRQNLLTGEWVLVSPQRTSRPWQGLVEGPAPDPPPAYDPECYLCPGNRRANDRRNPGYSGPFAFDNDFPALADKAEPGTAVHPLFVSRPEHGRCRVVCYSEAHNRHLAGMTVDEICAVFRFLFDEFATLDALSDVGYVQIFENRGQMMGASNPHPHAQIWATATLPVEPDKELRRQRDYYAAHGRTLLGDYLAAETGDRSRLICDNPEAVSLVPFWANWPFETLLVPRRPIAAPGELSDAGLEGFADVFRTTLAAYDRLFGVPMPYSMGFHPRPCDGHEHPEWHFHAHIYPPLLRSATIRKHMVGFEMLAMPQRDLTPEAAAERLRGALGENGSRSAAP
jgi:UDPglucose--hexose-1-phosphate uridylyltransferase